MIKKPHQLYKELVTVRSLRELEAILSRLDGGFSVWRFVEVVGDGYGYEVWYRARKVFVIMVRKGRCSIYRVYGNTDYFHELYGVKINEFPIGGG